MTTVIEHPATERPCAWLERHGWSVTRLGVDADGRARIDEARKVVGTGTALVTVMHSNNETGVLQPIGELSEIARAAGALVHTDAAQSVGKVPVRVRELGVDLLSIAGHKLYAPKGVGALYLRRGTPIDPFALGAGHERGLRPGTENEPTGLFHPRLRRRPWTGAVVLDVLKKAAGREDCALCELTYSPTGKRPARKACEARLGVAITELHRDRIPRDWNVQRGELPSSTNSRP